MIQAAINPSGEFLGLIIPKADLGGTISIFGKAADWEALLRGESVDQTKVGVLTVPTEESMAVIEVDQLPSEEGAAS